ncbi:non-canonical purine NTP pyrophosphatase [Candidatus Woesearchaeota archaeon]|nr:MAG: non-canonical purine NTP pyrophosphatase [Candidatus Woesearchaeota archaeon]
MRIIYLTGNKNKFREAQGILSGHELELKKIDLDEIQEINIDKIIIHKVKQGYNIIKKPLIVDDTGIFFEGLNGLPGGLVKWFLERLGPGGLYELVKDKSTNAHVECCVGYTNDGINVHVFKGIVYGKIVSPRGKEGFHFDKIFVPEGYDKTYSQMSAEEKNKISHRCIALKKLEKFLRGEKNGK